MFEVPVATREKPQVSCCDSRNPRRFSPQREMRPLSVAASREKSHLPSLALKGYLTPFRQLKKFPDIPVSTREEHRVSHHNSRRAPFSPPHLKMKVHSPASSAKESRHSRRTSRGGRSHPETPEELQGSFHNSKRPQCPCPLKIRPYSPATNRMRPQVSTHNTKEGLRARWHLWK